MTNDHRPDSNDPKQPHDKAEDALTRALGNGAAPPARPAAKADAMSSAMAAFDSVMAEAASHEAANPKTTKATQEVGRKPRRKIQHQRTGVVIRLGQGVKDFVMENRKEFLLATAASVSLLMVGVTLQMQQPNSFLFGDSAPSLSQVALSSTPQAEDIPGELSSPFYESILTPFNEEAAQRALERGRGFVPVLQGQLQVGESITLPLPPAPIPRAGNITVADAGDAAASAQPAAPAQQQVLIPQREAEPPVAPASPPVGFTSTPQGALIPKPQALPPGTVPQGDASELAVLADGVIVPVDPDAQRRMRQAAEDLQISQLRAERPALLRSLERATEQEQAAARMPQDAASAPALTEQTVNDLAVRSNMIGIPEPIVPPTPEEVGRDRFDPVAVNPVKVAANEPVSTFSIDVDTASYSFIRGQLNQGVLPQPDAVRIEEMINYFDYNYALPEDPSQPFAPNVAVYPTPWNDNTHIMHIGIKGFDLPVTEQPRANLTFLVDTSGSMNSADKLPLLQQSLRLLLDELGPADTIAIVAYAGAAGVVLEPTPVADRRTILNAINNMTAGGSTAGGAGIKLAYDLAAENFDAEAVNRVILGTDGDFNVGITSNQELQGFIERQRETGIFLSVLGFGDGNYNDSLMQALAQNGNGTAAYIDTLQEARKVLVDEASSTLFPIAKDVKIQVEFNPRQISEYRLIGYESRMLAREDFNNDRVDAGDIGSGHTVTALYEVVLVDNVAGRRIDPLRYGTAGDRGELSASTQEAVAEQLDDRTGANRATNLALTEFAFVKLRYKLPDEETSRLITRPVTATDVTRVDELSDDMRFAGAVAGFGQLLGEDRYLTPGFDYDQVIELANSAKGRDEFGERAEFVQMVRQAKSAQALR